VRKLRCPICGRVVEYREPDEVPDRPFCSARCRLVDLGRWFNEEYRIRVPLEPDAAVPPAPPPEE